MPQTQTPSLLAHQERRHAQLKRKIAQLGGLVFMEYFDEEESRLSYYDPRGEFVGALLNTAPRARWEYQDLPPENVVDYIQDAFLSRECPVDEEIGRADLLVVYRAAFEASVRHRHSAGHGLERLMLEASGSGICADEAEWLFEMPEVNAQLATLDREGWMALLSDQSPQVRALAMRYHSRFAAPILGRTR